LTTLPGSG